MVNASIISLKHQQVNYRLETRNEGGSVKMEMVLSPDLEQEMLLSNIKHSQQVDSSMSCSAIATVTI